MSTGDVWTVETLKAHFEQRFADQEKAVSAALASAEKAVAAALAAAEKAREQAAEDNKAWRANANEWRGSMVDREVRFASREEMASELKAVHAILATLKDAIISAGGERRGAALVKDESRANIAVIATLIGLAGLIAGWLLKR